MKKNKYCYISVFFTFIILFLAILFPRSFIRIYEAIRDLTECFIHYFCKLFDIDTAVSLHLNSLSSYDTKNQIEFFHFNNFGTSFQVLFKLSFNKETFFQYIGLLLQILVYFSKFLLLITPILLLIYLKYKSYFEENDNAINADSKPLKIYKKIENKLIHPGISFIKNYITYLKENRVFLIIWCCTFALYFNFFTIDIEILAYYFYFMTSFDVLNVFLQVYKLVLDLIPMIRFVPVPLWIILTIYLFQIIRKKRALRFLEKAEKKNQDFISKIGLSGMICGTMGKGKTTLLTDMGLSLTTMFRNKAFELILENDLKFPNFPYAVFESEIKRAMEYHQIYNLATCRIWVRKKEARFLKNQKKEKCFDYEFSKYGLTYYNGAKEITLFEMLENYVQLYFIYVVQSSLLITNYAIREDVVLDDLGNFPKWNFDFFNTNPEHMQAYSRHSHILDFDMLRLGKTMLKENKKRDAFEFGIVLITEGGKERGNMIDARGLKRDSDYANQLNDLFNTWLKMLRHSATVDNFPFIQVFFDEQRPESLGADIREVCDKIIFIEEKEKRKNPLLFFKLEDLIYTKLESTFKDIYYDYRYYRSDNTLFFYLLKKIIGHYHHYYDRLKNQFSYHNLKTSSKKGTLEGEFGNSKYIISYKKIYSRRFATDAFKDYFMEKSLFSPVGINDLPVFQSENATLEELQLENSYFIQELMRIRRNQKEDNKK